MTDEVAANTDLRRWGNRIVVVLVAAVVVPLGVSLLYHYSPTDSANYFYPGCTFNQLTGLHCPGCGATRCCYALVHGDLEQAFAWNPLFVLMLPIMVLVAIRSAYTMWTGRRIFHFRTPGWATKLLVGALIGFWIGRNIPIYPLDRLAPHSTEQTLARETETRDR